MALPSHQNPLDLPELRLYTAKYLSLDDRKACAVVCKAWHNDFQSTIWAYLNVRKGLTLPPKSHTQWMRSFLKNAHWLKHLDYPHDSRAPRKLYEMLLERCRAIETIVVGAQDTFEWDQFAQLVEMNPGLREVTQDSTTTVTIQSDSFSIAIATKRCHVRSDTDNNDTLKEALKKFCSTHHHRLATSTLEDDHAIHRLYKWMTTNDLERITSLCILSNLGYDPQCVAILDAIPIYQLQKARVSAQDPEMFRTLIKRQHHSLGELYGVTPDGHHDIVVDIFDKCDSLKVLDLQFEGDLDIRAILEGPWAFQHTLQELSLPLSLDPHCNDPALLGVAWRHKLEIHPYRDEAEQAELVFARNLGELSELRRVNFGNLRLNSNNVMICWWPQNLHHVEGILTEYRHVEH